MVLGGLESGFVKYEGTFFSQPERELRPRPFKSFRGRSFAAAISPESSRIMAELGIGILIIPQKPWDAMVSELDTYRAVFRSVNGVDAPPTIQAGWVFCDEDGDRARELGAQYIGAYYQTVLDHYQLSGDHLGATKGYEYYGKMSQALQEHGTDPARDFFVDLQVAGTPDQCFEKIMDIRSMVGSDSFVMVASYADMPAEEAERNMRLFAGSVLPRLRSAG
jgi:alkanesulfonate monooxygenase SsuD/methylene tetrahydromethanopterin reductase-like flavin-dependent oxidoreductase (luciferase family)